MRQKFSNLSKSDSEDRRRISHKRPLGKVSSGLLLKGSQSLTRAAALTANSGNQSITDRSFSQVRVDQDRYSESFTGTPKTARSTCRLDWHVGLYSPTENDPCSIASETPNQGATEVEPQHIARCGNDRDSGVLDAVPRCQSTFPAFIQLINKVKGLRVQRH